MTNYVQDLGGWTDSLKKIGSGALDVFQQYSEQKGQAAAYKSIAEQQAAVKRGGAAGGMPKWLLPVGIGAAALVLILVLKK